MVVAACKIHVEDEVASLEVPQSRRISTKGNWAFKIPGHCIHSSIAFLQERYVVLNRRCNWVRVCDSGQNMRERNNGLRMNKSSRIT